MDLSSGQVKNLHCLMSFIFCFRNLQDLFLGPTVQGSLRHLGIDLHGIGRLERRVPGHELEDEDSKGPPVHRIGVARGGDDFLSGHCQMANWKP